MLSPENIEHLRKCEFHNGQICKTCSVIINTLAIKPSGKRLPFYKVLSAESIEQKVSDKIKTDIGYFYAYMQPVIKTRGKKYEKSSLMSEAYEDISIHVLLRLFERNIGRNLPAKDILFISITRYKSEVAGYMRRYMERHRVESATTVTDFSQLFCGEKMADGLSRDEIEIVSMSLPDSNNDNSLVLDVRKFEAIKNRHDIDFSTVQNLMSIIIQDSKNLFSKEDYAILKLQHLENKSIEEISEITGINKTSVRLKQGAMLDCLRHYYGAHKEDKAFVGVTIQGDGKCKATFKVNGKSKHIGVYDDEVRAAIAYDEKMREIGRSEVNFPKTDREIKAGRHKLSISGIYEVVKKNPNASVENIVTRLYNGSDIPKSSKSGNKIRIKTVVEYLANSLSK